RDLRLPDLTVPPLHCGGNSGPLPLHHRGTAPGRARLHRRASGSVRGGVPSGARAGRGASALLGRAEQDALPSDRGDEANPRMASPSGGVRAAAPGAPARTRPSGGRSTAMKLLVDKNIEGQAAALFTILQADGWVDLLGLELLHLEDVGLAYD